MGEAFQCDRCGDLEAGEPSKLVQSAEDETPTVGMMFDQLCKSCADEHDAFMNGRSILPEEAFGVVRGFDFDDERVEDARRPVFETGRYDPVERIEMTFTVGSSPYKDGQPDLPDYMTAGGANY